MKFFSALNLLLFCCVCLFTACVNQVPAAVKDDAQTIDSLSYLAAIEQQELANKKLVADFYQELYGDKNIDAIDKYLDSNYVQHNPSIGDGKESLRVAFKVWYKGALKEKIDIRHLAADGNFVYLHTRSIENGKTVAIMDIYRVENGKIMEHWDITQPVPELSVSKHPMF